MLPSLALIGCGKMGQALLSGWLKHKINYAITVVQPDPLPADFPQAGYNHISKLNYKKTFDIIVFAVKPQILNDVIHDYIDAVHNDTLVLSIAAGKGITTFEKAFGQNQPIIRVMPNTPAAIGKGVSAFIQNDAVTQDQKDTTEMLFKPCGETLWLRHEDDMDAVTAVSGSGPAYLFYMIEALTTAARKAGLDDPTSEKLARQTIIGAAALAEAESSSSAQTLRENVTSPGGTTEAALKVLMNGAFEECLSNAVLAAKKRSQELKS